MLGQEYGKSKGLSIETYSSVDSSLESDRFESESESKNRDDVFTDVLLYRLDIIS